MAAITSRPAPMGAISVFRMVQSLIWKAGRITRRALNKLSNRELDDIGLCRGDIELIGR